MPNPSKSRGHAAEPSQHRWAGIVPRANALTRATRRRQPECSSATVADIGYFLTVTFATTLGAGLADAHPELQSWYGRVAGRPAVAKETLGMAAAMERAAAA